MNKLTKQLLSLVLCILMVTESGFNAGMVGYAAQEPASLSTGNYAVKALAQLADDVSYQVVPYGTAQSKLNLPKTIFALATEETAESEEDESDTDEVVEDTIEVATDSDVVIDVAETPVSDTESTTETTTDAAALAESDTDSTTETTTDAAASAESDTESTVETTTDAVANAESNTDTAAETTTDVVTVADDETADVATDSDVVTVDETTADTTAAESIATASIISDSIDFMSSEQKDKLVELLSGDKKPSIKEIQKETGLNLSGYSVIRLPLSWSSDPTFGGEYDPETAGTYRFISEVKDEDKYVLYDDALPTIDVEVLSEDCEPFSASWTDEDDHVEITVTAPEGTFPNGSSLKVEKITDEKDNLKITEAVETALDEKKVKTAYSYDIKVLDADGHEVEPQTVGGRDVSISFKSTAIKDAATDEKQYVSVYHFDGVDKKDVEKAASADEQDSLLGKVMSFITNESGDKLETPEHMEAQAPEDTAAISETAESTEDTESTETEAPATDDSAMVSADGELKIETDSFSVYTVVFYSDKANLNAYYVTLTNTYDTYSYNEGDKLQLSIASSSTLANAKCATFVTDKKAFEEYVQTVTDDPSKLEDDFSSIESSTTVTVDPTATGIGIITDATDIDINVDALISGDVSYNVEAEPVHCTEAADGSITNANINWYLNASFYVTQTTDGNVTDDITYVISGFGDNGGSMNITVDDAGKKTYNSVSVSGIDGTYEVTVAPTCTKIIIDQASDVLSIMPKTSDAYAVKLGDAEVTEAQVISSDETAPTAFTVVNKKDYEYKVSTTITQNGDAFTPDDKDVIDYNFSGLVAGEEVKAVAGNGGTEIISGTADNDGKVTLSINANVSEFTLLSKSTTVVAGDPVNSDSSVNNIVYKECTSDTANKTFKFSFVVPTLKVKIVDTDGNVLVDVDGNKKEGIAYKALYENLFTSTDVSALYDVTGYVYKSAKLDTTADKEAVTVDDITSVSNKEYKTKTTGDKANALTENAVLQLTYAKLYTYPIYVQTENVTKNNAITVQLSDLDAKNVKAYLLYADTKEVASKLADGVESFTFKPVADTTEYYLMLVTEDKDVSAQIVTNGTNYQNNAGTGLKGQDSIVLKEQETDSDYKENQFFVEQMSSSIAVKKLWEDGGKSDDEKNELVGQDVENLMHLEYYIEGISTGWQTLDATAMTEVLGYTAAKAKTVPTPGNASASKNASAYVYTFASKLYTSYVYRDAAGDIHTAPIYYRIAEDAELKKHYFSFYEDADGNYDETGAATTSTVLRNYEKQTYTATIDWKDADKLDTDRPTIDKWLECVALYKITRGQNQNNGEKEEIKSTVSMIPVTTSDIDDLQEGAIQVVDNGDDTWTVTITGFKYDKNDYNVHYYITQDLPGLQDTKAKDGNEISNRRYDPVCVNVGNAANRTEELFNGGTLNNVLTGDTQYIMYKLWKDDAIDETVSKRPTAKILISRYARTVEDTTNWSHVAHMSPIQNETYHAIEATVTEDEAGNKYDANKLYKLIVPANGYVSAYNTDGEELVYVGKEAMDYDEGDNRYETKLINKLEGGNETALHGGHFVKNGETLINRITGTVTVVASKSWIAKARQDVHAKVELSLYQTNVDPDKSSNYDKDKSVKLASTSTLEGFSSEVTSQAHSWKLPKYDEEGRRLYYYIEETSVATKVGGDYEKAYFETIETEDGKNIYFVTDDGYRYKQTTVTNRNTDGNVEIDIYNRLVGNAQVKIVKNFPDGLSQADLDRKDGAKAEVSFDVFQDNTKIGVITRTYKVGETLHSLDGDGNVVETEITSLDQLKASFSDIIVIDAYDDADFTSKETAETGLLPRYTSDGTEYTYTAFEHEDATGRGYYPTVKNLMSEETYTTTDLAAVQPYNKDLKDKYRLDTVKISNGTGKDDIFTIYKEWLDGDESDTRETITTVLQYREDSDSDSAWQQVGGEYVIDPNADKYIFAGVPDEVKSQFNAWRSNGYKPTATSGEFRLVETKVGDHEVHYYTGTGNTIKDDFERADDYLAHDWDKYEGQEASFSAIKSESDDYGFVTGTNHDYDVLMIDSETAAGKYYGYSYEEDGNVIANRDFDFAVSNRRVGVVYVNIKKTWKDGKLAKVARPDALKLKVQIGKETYDVTLSEDNDWTASVGPFRKYGAKGELISYEPKLVETSKDSYEELVYTTKRGDLTAQEAESKYASLYVMSGSKTATLTVGELRHTGDKYDISVNNTLGGTITPIVNKFWEDYDYDDGISNNRPDIYSVLYRSYVDDAGKEVVEQIDKDKYYDYDWDTVKDELTHNWWQVKYKPLPRFSDNYEEYTYYIGEEYASQNTNEYVEIGAFEGSPSYVDETTKEVATFSTFGKKIQTIELSNGKKVVAAKVATSSELAGTIVNRPRNKRTVSGVKIYDNIPAGYSNENLPDVTLALYRKAYGSDEEKQVQECTRGEDDLGNEILEPTGRYLYETLHGAAENKKRTFTFHNADGSVAYVDKYDETGRPYTYTVREVGYNASDSEIVDSTKQDKSQTILDSVYTLHVEDTLTNGVEATNAYNQLKGYEITVYKKWTGYDPETKTYDGMYLDPKVDRPRVYVRLYQYLQDGNGNIITGTAKEKGNKYLYYDSNNPEYTSYTWTNLDYYAPNLRPYVYTVEEWVQSGDWTRGYKAYPALVVKDSEGRVTLEKASKSELITVKHGWWPGYQAVVSGSYDIVSKTGSGTVGIINEYQKNRTILKISKLWTDVANKYDDITTLPEEIKFRLYRIKGSTPNPETDTYIDTIKLKPDEWKATVSNLLKYDPQGKYYKYYVEEDNASFSNIPFVVETEDDSFYGGGKSIIVEQTGTEDENLLGTGRRNVIKTVNLSVTKALKSKSGDVLTSDKLKALYAQKAIPEKINYRVYKKIGKGNWTELKQDDKPVTLTSSFNESTGAYKEVSISGLPMYSYNSDSKDYEEIEYRAVEYSAEYADGTVTRDDASINEELNATYTEKTTVDGFGQFQIVTSQTTKSATDGAKVPYSYHTNVTNTIDLTKLDVTKQWTGEVRGFDSSDVNKVEKVTFKLQRRLATQSEATDWRDVCEYDSKGNDTVKTATIERWSEDDQTKSFEPLPYSDKYGNKYSYRAVETLITLKDGTEITVDIPVETDDATTGSQTGGTKAYEYTSTHETASGSEIYTETVTTTATNRLRYGSIKVTKTWEDSNDRYRLRPDSIKVKLESSVEMKDETTLVEEIISDITNPIQALLDYIRNLINHGAASTQKTAEPDLTSVMGIETLSADNNWTASFDKLPLYDVDDNQITYTITEYVVDEDGKVSIIGSYDATHEVQEGSTETGDSTKLVINTEDVPATASFINTLATTSYIVEKYWDTAETDPTLANDTVKRRVNVALQVLDGDNWKPVEAYTDVKESKTATSSELTAVLDEANAYRATFSDIPKRDEGGNDFEYRVVETSIEVQTQDGTWKTLKVKTEDEMTGIVGGYNYTTEWTKQDGYQMASISNILKKGDYHVTKVWDDDGNRDGIRPDSITFHLQRKATTDSEWTKLPKSFDRTITYQKEAAAGKWTTATWSQLPIETPAGDKYNYRAVEDEATHYQQLTAAGKTEDEDAGTALTESSAEISTYSNLHKIYTTDITAVKKWQDSDDKYGDRPESIEVTLYARYSIASGSEITEVVENRELADGKDEAIENPVILNKKNDWTVTWTGLPEYKRGLTGAKITYFVEEHDVKGYDIKGYDLATSSEITAGTYDETATVSELTLTNTLDPVKITVIKNWKNEHAGIGKNVTGAEVVLQRKTDSTDWTNVTETVDGKETTVIHVIKKTDDSYTVKDLPRYDSKGNAYSYRAVESRIILSDGTVVNVKDAGDFTSGTVGAYVYISETTEDEAGFHTEITNTMETGSLKVTKVWSDSNDSRGKRPASLKVTLSTYVNEGGALQAITIDGLPTTTTLNADNGWTDSTTWADIPVFTAEGKRIYYRLAEDNISSYNAQYESVTYGQAAVTGTGVTATEVYVESGKTSQVTFTNTIYSGKGGSGGGSSSYTTPPTENKRVLGESRDADRENPEEPRVLGEARYPHTGDMSNMMYYGIGAVMSMAVLAGWYYAYKKKKGHKTV